MAKVIMYVGVMNASDLAKAISANRPVFSVDIVEGGGIDMNDNAYDTFYVTDGNFPWSIVKTTMDLVLNASIDERKLGKCECGRPVEYAVQCNDCAELEREYLSELFETEGPRTF